MVHGLLGLYEVQAFNRIIQGVHFHDFQFEGGFTQCYIFLFEINGQADHFPIGSNGYTTS